MTEKDIESYLRDVVRKIGGKAYKFVSPGNPGVPDRIVILPDGRILFVELKAPGKVSTPLQLLKQTELIRMGCTVYPDIRSKTEVISMLAKEGFVV